MPRGPGVVDDNEVAHRGKGPDDFIKRLEATIAKAFYTTSVAIARATIRPTNNNILMRIMLMMMMILMMMD